ncbi:Carboxymuconolactone decarboxylase [Gloeocapsa sp. PCC 7428]|jgi:alkylhydroperoxidase/carboxymuconolactone decarboxylase family protein YurZ|uniref:carboxymuconolactone decarboxylase family protein n=1 Tax=Gloeocapsa sp. PCC 7428 TaxID=1173026 RepID=UPI0002A5ED69|nr:carboxymuconolactone decarboxylase family protein [Gloeocapsa sp. PCC 7428]AFZ33245.1 Carboxymuconolactone decarboxylase [Gloeocapsa sp. PCC 7428]
MKNMMQEAPDVAQSFFDLAKSVKQYSPLDEKVNELIIIGIFSAHRGLRGINTHVERAMAAGATKEEVIAAILLALPIVGITDVNMALDQAMETIAMTADKKEVAGAAAG